MTGGSDGECQLISIAFEAAMLELERLSERPRPRINKGDTRLHRGSQETDNPVEVTTVIGASLGRTIVEES